MRIIVAEVITLENSGLYGVINIVAGVITRRFKDFAEKHPRLTKERIKSRVDRPDSVVPARRTKKG